MTRYWVHTEAGPQGPYEVEAMREWLRPEHYVAPEGGTAWQPAGEVPELAALFGMPPAAPAAAGGAVPTAGAAQETGEAAVPAIARARPAEGGHAKHDEPPPAPGEGWKVIHRDGREEGPISFRALREKIRQRILAPDTAIQHDHWDEPRLLKTTRLLARAQGKDDLDELHWELYEIALTAPTDLLRHEYKKCRRDYHPKEWEIIEAEAKARGIA